MLAEHLQKMKYSLAVLRKDCDTLTLFYSTNLPGTPSKWPSKGKVHIVLTRCYAGVRSLVSEGTKLHFKQMILDICEGPFLKLLRVEDVFFFGCFLLSWVPGTAAEKFVCPTVSASKTARRVILPSVNDCTRCKATEQSTWAWRSELSVLSSTNLIWPGEVTQTVPPFP